jgi:pyruvate-ferredoxin/flavodoxin oxidoreductase
VANNCAAVDRALDRLEEVQVPSSVTATRERPPLVGSHAPDFVQRVTAVMMAGKGDLLPVSAFPPDGTWPTGTARWEKRAVSLEVPVWDAALCIQCNKCTLICPHAAIRAKAYPRSALGDDAEMLEHVPFKSKELRDHEYTLQISPDDCTGCRLCVAICPVADKKQPGHKALDMHAAAPLRHSQQESFQRFLALPELARSDVRLDVKHSQFFEPLFEFSGACAGCGETPYLKLLTQLFGDRTLIANATGCSSIFGGNLPTTPYCKNAEGRGPAWANSLFEDNAEFGLGMRLSLDQHQRQARQLLAELHDEVGDGLAAELLAATQSDEEQIAQQRERVDRLRAALGQLRDPRARRLDSLADYLVDKSVWIVGGDGWAYDIGYGGLDHVLASGANVNVLVLDTEVYSNTGGQQSKSTPRGATAKFAAGGKAQAKKDLAMLAMAYGNVYVARIALGADDKQTLKALLEAQSYPGPSLIIAYSHCIAHGYDLAQALDHHEAAVTSGYWPLLRYDPRRRQRGEPALVLDSKPPSTRVADFAYQETRFRVLRSSNPDRAAELMRAAEEDAARRYRLYQELARV